jgi:crotonobetainyl-CoA hydratase
MNDVVTTRTEDGVFEVTLDRPKANAIDLETSRLLGETFKNFRDDPDLKVAIMAMLLTVTTVLEGLEVCRNCVG